MMDKLIDGLYDIYYKEAEFKWLDLTITSYCNEYGWFIKVISMSGVEKHYECLGAYENDYVKDLRGASPVEMSECIVSDYVFAGL